MTQAIEAASQPATPDQIAIRAMEIIGQYFVGQAPKRVTDATARYWSENCKDLPDWAIDAACVWWVGPGNTEKDRGRRPQPGDIAAQARVALGPVIAAQTKLRWWEKYRGAYPQFILESDNRGEPVA